MKLTKKEFEKILKDKVVSECGVTLDVASAEQIYRCMAMIVRQIMSDRQKQFQAKTLGEGKKQVYYLCMEFLMGRSLKNNLFNLGLEANFREALSQMEALRTAAPERRAFGFVPPTAVKNSADKPLLTVSLHRAEQLSEELVALVPARVYVPVELLPQLDLSPHLGRTEFFAVLPRIYRTQERYSGLVCTIAAELDVPCVDPRERFLDGVDPRASNAEDGIHLSEAGYEMFYTTLIEQVRAVVV